MRIPAILPYGCSKPGGCYRTLPSLADSSVVQCRDLSIMLATWFDRVEEELYDILGQSGVNTQRRSQGPRFVTRPALGKPGSALPRVSPVTVAWRTLATWFTCLIANWGMDDNGLQASHTARRARWRLLNTQWHYLGNGRHGPALRSWVANLSGPLLDNRCFVVW
eukprot:7232211-Karenia_brevis.AAC.1